MSTLDETLELLDDAVGRVSRPTIAAGASVDINWLNKLATRKIQDPGIKKVERLRDFLKKQRRTEAAP